MTSSWKTKTPWRSNPGLSWRMARRSVSSVWQWRLAVRVSPGSRKSTWAHLWSSLLMALLWVSLLQEMICVFAWWMLSWFRLTHDYAMSPYPLTQCTAETALLDGCVSCIRVIHQRSYMVIFGTQRVHNFL